MLGSIQSFIGQVSAVLDNQGKSLGISSGQAELIQQILNLIKNIIADGLQRGDLSKLVMLIGEIGDMIPELKEAVNEIVKDLKVLYKKLFGPDAKARKSLLGSGQDALQLQEIGERGVLTDDELISQLDDVSEANPGDIMVDKALLKETSEERLAIAESILNILNDHIILSSKNMDLLASKLQKIDTMASIPEKESSHAISEVTRIVTDLSSDLH